MKKLLGSLMAVTLVASVSSTVVACARGPKMQQISTTFSTKKIGSETYESDAMWTAFNGTNASIYGASTPLKTLSRNILNLLGFNQTLVTQPKRIKDFREFYIGNDAVDPADSGKLLYTPSVDGTFYGEKVIGINQADFYNKYVNTQINSIAGLYALYQYNLSNPAAVTAAGAAASLNVINAGFANNQTAMQQFMNSFLDLNSNNLDSAWTSQKFNFGSDTDLAPLKLDSKVTPFDQMSEDVDGVKTNTLTFKNDSKNLGVPTDFTKLNTGIEADNKAKIGNNKSAPFDLLLLPPVNDADVQNASAQATFNLNWNYPPEENKDSIDGTKVWDMRQSDTDPTPWQFNATEAQVSKEGVKPIQKGYVKVNESMVVKIKPIEIQYEYSTNVRNASAPKFIVNMTIDGIYAVFNPVGYQTKFAKEKEDSKTLGNRFMKWQFSHYQFNNINNVYSKPGSEKSKTPTDGYYSGFKITSISVQNG